MREILTLLFFGIFSLGGSRFVFAYDRDVDLPRNGDTYPVYETPPITQIDPFGSENFEISNSMLDIGVLACNNDVDGKGARPYLWTKNPIVNNLEDQGPFYFESEAKCLEYARAVSFNLKSEPVIAVNVKTNKVISVHATAGGHL